MSHYYPRPPRGQRGYDPTIRPPRGQHGSGPGPSRPPTNRIGGGMTDPGGLHYAPGSALDQAWNLPSLTPKPPRAQAQVAFDPSQLANYQPGGGRTALGDAIRSGAGANNQALIAAIRQMDPNALALLLAARRKSPVTKRGGGSDISGVFTPKV